MIGIVVSRADGASEHVGEQLLDLAEWDEREPPRPGIDARHVRDGFELLAFEDLHVHLQGADEPFDDPDLLVFVSRHSGETGALLTAHFTGNFGAAEFGGEPGELARAAPNAHAAVLERLRERAPPGYEVGTECTHHGPSDLGTPSMFVEVGSGEEQWRDPAAARAVARAVLDLEGVAPDRERAVVGFGGGHYAPRFERIVRETGWAVGHVAADWALAEATGDAVEAAFVESRASRAVIDGERPDLAARIQERDYRVVSETWLRETDGVPLDSVADLEAALSTVGEGLRFGELAGEGRGFEVYEPDPSLLADAHGVDPERSRRAVAANAVAYETEEGGNRVAGRVAVPPGGRDALIDALADVLAERYEAVERGDGALIARERAFDPGRARDLGVPEGPAFGRLAGGEPVCVEGREVTPDEVHEERERRYRT